MLSKNDVFAEKLSGFSASLTPPERANYKLLLGLAAGKLVPSFDEPITVEQRAAFNSVSNALSSLQPYGDRVPQSGVAYRGRPAFMTDELLHSLQQEARERRATAEPFEEHFLGRGAPIANQFATSPDLVSLVQQHAGSVKATGIASFLYYDAEGLGIEPHIDTDTFSLNTLLMLDHQHGVGAPSRLVLFPADGQATEYALEPGEFIIFYAGTVAHGRRPMKLNEKVSILTFGFHPLGLA